MANEVTVSASLSVTESSITKTMAESAVNFDLVNVTPTKFVEGLQEIGTSEEAIDMGDITAPGWCFMKNIDATNFIEIYSATAETAMFKLLPGEFFVGKLSATAPFAKADVAICHLQYLIYEA
jgi:hypothetical protein